MSNEIATYSMILSKLSLGKSGTECPTKTQILAINSLIVIENASTYGANECVKIDDIRKKVETWNYYLTVSPTSMSFGAGGGSKSFTVSSYKRKVLDGVEQSGDTSVSLKSTTISGTGFSLSGTTVSASANEGTSNRTGTVTITQNESNKTATCTVTQAGAEPTIEYVFTISPWQVNVGASGGTGDIGFTSYKLVNGNQISLGYSIDSSTLPSWATYSNGRFTISSNSSTSSRSANVYFTQSESGKRDYATITQSGYVSPADNYVFTWEDGSTSDVSASFPWNFSANGTAANIPVVSTKNGSSQSWSVSSKPSWITTSTTSSKVTISASDNSGSARSGTIVLTQSGSNKTLRINVTQAAYSATVEWRYRIGFANGSRSNISTVCRDYHEVEKYESYIFTVTFLSYKSKYVDGVEDTSTRQYLDFSMSSSQTWLTATKRTSSNANEGKFAITLSENESASNRTGTITVTQNESQKTITCDTTQVGSDAFVASYFVRFKGSDTYPSEINFGLVTAPTSKEFEVKSSLEIYTIDSEYDSYDYHFRVLRRGYMVDNFMNIADNSWFTNTYEVGGGSHPYDLLTINAPVSDDRDHESDILIMQSRYAGDIDWKYRELTNSPIFGRIMIKQAGNKIS